MIPAHQQCTYCGHQTHPAECPATIQTSGGKKPERKPCPCAQRAPKNPNTPNHQKGNQ